jgi:hypothetical protein
VRRLAPLLLITFCGCSYFSGRWDDFADCWRLEGNLAVPTAIWVHAGPVAHLGVGGVDNFELHSTEFKSMSSGPRYHLPERARRGAAERYFLVVHRVTDQDMKGRGGERNLHECFGILPGILHRTGQDRDLLHLWDVEVGVSPLFVGLNIGVSPGELLDFLLGWFGIDLGGDDAEPGRRDRRLQRRIETEPPEEK